MSDHSDIRHGDAPIDTTSGAARRTTGQVVAQLAIEVAIGLGVAALIVAVAWASSNAIRFVYGGY
jgi:hypothetical protein